MMMQKSRSPQVVIYWQVVELHKSSGGSRAVDYPRISGS
jgi:hypothetical protein